MTDALQALGYRGVVASNGCDALRVAQLRQPDLILVDAELSDLDGISVLQLLRCLPSTREIPTALLEPFEICGNGLPLAGHATRPHACNEACAGRQIQRIEELSAGRRGREDQRSAGPA